MPTVKNVSVTGGQKFRITVNGLLPTTEYILFFNSTKVTGSSGNFYNRLYVDDISYYPVGDMSKLFTDINGRIDFEFIYSDELVDSNYTTEEQFYSFSNTNSGQKNIMLIDKVSADQLEGPLVDTADVSSRTATLRKARSYSESTISITYDITFVKPPPVVVAPTYSVASSSSYGGEADFGTPSTSGFDFGIAADPSFGDLGQTSASDAIGGYDFGLGFGFDGVGAGDGGDGGAAGGDADGIGEGDW